MYWKCVFINLLLVIPHNRMCILASFDSQQDYGRKLNAELSGEELIDKIIEQLSSRDAPRQTDNTINQAVAGGTAEQNLGSGQIPQAEKKDGATPESPGTGIKNEPPSKNNQGGSDAGTTLALGVPGQVSSWQHEEHVDDSRKSGFIDTEDKIFIIVVAIAVSTGFIGLMLAGVFYYRFRRNAKAASEVEYPAYGVTGPMKDRVPSPGDRKLAQSAQMYHYQHQKQQMIAMEKANGDMKHDASEDDSEEDNMEGDYTVYECPGLAPTGEMEIRNPLFRGEDTPVTPGEDITGQPHEPQPPAAERSSQ